MRCRRRHRCRRLSYRLFGGGHCCGIRVVGGFSESDETGYRRLLRVYTSYLVARCGCGSRRTRRRGSFAGFVCGKNDVRYELWIPWSTPTFQLRLVRHFSQSQDMHVQLVARPVEYTSFALSTLTGLRRAIDTLGSMADTWAGSQSLF